MGTSGRESRLPRDCCIVTVGGSGVGTNLIKRVANAYPLATEKLPRLPVIVAVGPRIDRSVVIPRDGLEVREFVPGLHRHLAASDIVLVQGGLTTTMELTASRRPFIYFPLQLHFEQNFHVRPRLNRYGAGRCMDYESATPERIAEAMPQELSRAVDYRPVETDGAYRAAYLIADLL